MKSRFRFFALLVLALTAAVAVQFFISRARMAQSETRPEAVLRGESANRKPDIPDKARLSESFSKLPLRFEINNGQLDPRVKFVSRGAGYTMFLTESEAVLALSKPAPEDAATKETMTDAGDEVGDESLAQAKTRVRARQQTDTLRMKLAGANAKARVGGMEKLSGKSNYFNGSNPRRWRTDVSAFAKVKYEQVYPGIDLIYYGNQGQLEYDFHVAPGADPRLVRFDVEGAENLRLDETGDLIIATKGGELRQHKPVIFQQTEAGKQIIAGRYRLRGKGEIGFDVGEYDKSKPLIIDPILSYSSYIGGSGADSVTVDAAGNIYVAGFVDQTNFVFAAVNSAIQSQPGGGLGDGFVIKLAPDGNQFIYGTYFGGSDYDEVFRVTADAEGNAYLTGITRSTNFPTTAGALQRTNNGVRDAFAAKLNPAGNAIIFSTLFGGSDNDLGYGIAPDASGNVYLTGYTESADLRTTPGAFQTVKKGGRDAFAAKLNATGTDLIYSTFIGGDGNDTAEGFAADAGGNVYLAGSTTSVNYPTQNPFQTSRTDEGIYVSTNRGDSFSQAPPIAERVVLSFAFLPRDPDIVFAGTLSGVYRTTDGGLTITRTSLNSVFVRAIAIDSSNSAVYAGTANGVFKSTDTGETWTAVNNGLVNANSQSGFQQIRALAVAASNIIYAGTLSNGVFSTNNGGANWFTVNNGLPANSTINALAVSPSNSQRLYAAVNGRGIFITNDGGASWTESNAGFTNTNGTPLTALAITIDRSNGDIYLGAAGSGVYKSTNNGASWSPTNNGLTFTNDAGQTVTANVRAVTIESPPEAASIIYAGTNVGVYRSTDGGANWQRKINGLTVPNLASLLITPGGGQTPPVLFAGVNGDSDATITKLNAAGSGLVYATYLAGNSDDFAQAVAIDASGSAYVTGGTFSPNLPVTAGVVKPTHPAGEQDAFVAKLNPAGSGLSYLTYLGGGTAQVPRNDFASGIAVDAAGNAHVFGQTAANDFPVFNAFQSQRGGDPSQITNDFFVTKLNPTATAYLYSSYLGGGSNEFIFGQGSNIALDPNGDAYVVGLTTSNNYPTSQNAIRFSNFQNVNESVVSKISDTGTTFSITGRILLSDGNPASDVFLQLTDSQNGNFFLQTLTDARGFYQFVSVPPGNYTVTPFGGSQNFRFTPASAPVTIGNADVREVNFTATPIFSIQGRITDVNNPDRGISGVTVTLSGTQSATFTTDASGFYFFDNLAGGGNYTVTPSRTSATGATYTFTPPNAVFNNLQANQAAGFTTPSAQFFTVSGRITDAGGAPIANVNILLSGQRGGFTPTDSNGSYAFGTLQEGETYFITPSRVATVFTPQRGDVPPLTGDATVNFTAAPASGLISRIAFVRNVNPAPLITSPPVTPPNAATRFKSRRTSNPLGGAPPTDILIINADGTGETNLTNTQNFNENSPEWSPDGTRLAFSSNRNPDNFNFDLYTMNADGTNVTRVTDTPDIDELEPTWSPDSTKLAFAARSNVDFQTQIFTVNLDGSNRVQLTNTPAMEDSSPTWSPNGTRIAFVRAAVQSNEDTQSISDIYAVNANDGGNLTRLTDVDTNDGDSDISRAFNPVYSPDGTRIAFNIFRDIITNNQFIGSVANIFVMNADGSLQRNVTNDPATQFGSQNSDPTWSPDNLKLGYTGNVGNNETFAINLDGTNRTQITSAPNSFGSFEPAWQPQGGTNPPTTFTVTNTNDAGLGSLRQAIFLSNDTQGTQTIAFNIAGSGVQTIAPASPLPTITDAVVIDGYSQPGATANTLVTGENAVILIELNGANAGVNADGIRITGTNSIVRGLAINRFTRDGVLLSGGDNNTISGNFIGTDPTGTIDLGNGVVGVEGEFGSNANNNLIGGTTPAARNIISGNGSTGIEFNFAQGNVIQGNFIGLAADGATALGNSGVGVGAGSFTGGTLIGGDDAADGTTDGIVGARNYISGNGGSGVFTGGSAFGGSTIRGNYIGTDVTGTLARPNNGGIGTNIASGAIVGGSTPGAGNLISGNTGTGITIANTGNFIVRGNRIGTQADGVNSLGNGGSGVEIVVGGSNNSIGGTAAGEGNIIAFNGGGGIRIENAVTNPVLRNSIFSNGGLGIDLGFDAVTPNDAGDADTGANNLQNFPVLTSATNTNGTTTIQGTLNSTPNTTYRIELFANDACDASGNGEGQTFIGATTAGTDANGNAAGDSGINLNAAVPVGQFITATATDPAGNTSEFSACRQVTAAPQRVNLLLTKTDSPDPVTVGNQLTYTITVRNNPVGTATQQATGVTVTDVLPQGVTFVSASDGCTFSNNTVTCNLGTIASSTTRNAVIVVTPNAAGTIINTASVTSTEQEDNGEDNTATATTAVNSTATFTNPIPYLSQADSPFAATINSGNTILETFEDGALNTRGVTASTGSVTNPGALTDSVDGDDGNIDGSGTGGRSLFSNNGAAGITFTFDASVLGALPTQAGIVWTDGAGTTTFEAFDRNGASLGTTGPVAIADNSNSGTTGEDRFFGVTNQNGISAIRISNTSGGIEVDHLQYGLFAAQTFTISGRVINGATQDGIGGVTVTLSGAQSATTPTDTNGNYTFTNLTAGANYTVTPSSNNFTFTPPAASFQNLQANQTANFTATLLTADLSINVSDAPDPVTVGANLTYTLSIANAGTSAANNARVTSSIPSNVEVVSFSGSDGAECAATGTALTCSFGNLNAGASRTVNLVVRPSQAGTLNVTASVTSDTTDPNTANNTATQSTTVNAAVSTFSISGRVANPANVALADVNVRVTDAGGQTIANAASDASGNYTIANLVAGGTYTVTPSREGFTFTPPNRIFENLNANQTGDFQATPAPAALVADYQFQNTLNSSAGSAPALTDIGVGGNSFVTEAVGSTPRTTLNFPRGSGVALAPTSGVIPNNSYTIILLFRFDEITGFRRIVDFKNGTSDSGLYNLSGALDFFASAGRGSGTPIQPNAFVQVALTRDAGTGNVVGYVNGVAQFSFTDSSNLALIDDNNTLRFFVDDNSVGGEQSAGAVARIRLYNGALSASEIAALTENIGTPLTFTISGNIRSNGGDNGSNVSGVTVTLSGSQTASTTTDTGGNYSFANLAAGGDYTVTPSRDNTTFTPPNRAFTNLQAAQTADFQATSAPSGALSITGRTTDTNGNPLAGVAVTITDSPSSVTPVTTTTVTDGNGNYTFTGLTANRDYSVSASAADIAFQPPRRDISALTSSQTGIDFVGTRRTVRPPAGNLQITGRITTADDAGVAGITVTLSGTITATTTTDQNGNFAFTGLAPGTYSVTPTTFGFTFTPARRDFAGITSNQTADFAATAQANPTPTPFPQDGFNDPATTAQNFNRGTLSQTGNFDPQIPVVVQNGQLEITPRTGSGTPAFNGLVSVRAIDLVETPTVSVEVKQVTNGGAAQTVFAVGSSPDDFFRFLVSDPAIAPPSLTFDPNTKLVSEKVTTKKVVRPLGGTTGQQLSFQAVVGGQSFVTGVTYNPVQHRFWRFRNDAVRQLVFFETSPDAVTWTTQFPSAGETYPTLAPGSTNALAAELAAGTLRSTANPGSAVFDNFVVTSPPGVGFAATDFSVPEGQSTAVITITRTGNTDSAARVNFTTTDRTAQAGIDYTPVSGTLDFAAGERSKTITINLLSNSTIGDRTIGLILSNPVGTIVLPGRDVVPLVIIDDDDPRRRNPIDDSNFFTRQQILDIFNRQITPTGSVVITRNALRSRTRNGLGKTPRFDNKRAIEVAALLNSPEFANVNAFIARLYRTAFARPVTLMEFVADAQSLAAGAITTDGRINLSILNRNKANLVTEFIARSPFMTRYQNLGATEYVDALYANTGIRPSSNERAALILGLITNRETRGTVLRRITDNQAFVAQEANRTLALFAFFDFFRTDPDAATLAALTERINRAGSLLASGILQEFLNSPQYRARFGRA